MYRSGGIICVVIYIYFAIHIYLVKCIYSSTYLSGIMYYLIVYIYIWLPVYLVVCFCLVIYIAVICVMKMGKTMPRVGLEPPSLAFRASVLPLHHIGSPMSPLYPHTPVCAAPCLRGQCRLLHSK